MKKMKATTKTYTEEELLERRIAGILPRIDINGDAFIIDLRLMELRAERDPFIRIDLAHLPMDDAGDNYLCFYNTKEHIEDPPNPEMTELPKDVVLLTIPNESRLDPVGLARQYGLPDDGLLEKFPIQPDLKAIVTALDQTELTWLVDRNLEKQRRLNESRQLRRKARSKGKGL